MRKVAMGFWMLFVAITSLAMNPSMILAQEMTGEIETVGFQGRYRADCWTPMVVRLKGGTIPAGKYQLQVRQYDIDGDLPIFTRDIEVNPEDQLTDKRSWVYFLPEPIEQGLPDAETNSSLAQLNRRLHVILASQDGKKPLAEFPVTQTISRIDSYLAGGMSRKSRKMILCVTDSGSSPAFAEYAGAVGIKEDVDFVRVRVSDLPDHVLGYDGIDGILWLGVDPLELERAGQTKKRVLRDYVESGGRLVICAGADTWQNLVGFGDMLPVTMFGTKSNSTLMPLRKLARNEDRKSRWEKIPGPFVMIIASERPGSVVEEWIDWKQDKSYSQRSPYLVRKAMGLGFVAWVAQNLGDAQLTSRDNAGFVLQELDEANSRLRAINQPMEVFGGLPGWPFVWDRVFDWNNDTHLASAEQLKKQNYSKAEWLDTQVKYYEPSSVADISFPLNRATEFEEKSAGFLAIIILFFIIYWILAGPVGFVFLSTKKRTHMSWPLYAVTALAATTVSALIVRLILGGGTEVKHLTLVRVAPNQTAEVISRLGIYVRKDGEQTISIPRGSEDAACQVYPFTPHPNNAPESLDYKARMEYPVSLYDPSKSAPPSLNVPFRSTSKQFVARWRGPWAEAITGALKLDPNDGTFGIRGRITSNLQTDLSRVFIAYQVPGDNHRDKTTKLLYLETLKAGQSIDVRQAFQPFWFIGSDGNTQAVPGQGKPIYGELGSVRGGNAWSNYWYRKINPDQTGRGAYGNNDPTADLMFPMLSFFDLIPPARAEDASGNRRFEMLRRGGGREFDISPAVSAGQLVVIGTASGGNPLKVQLSGSNIDGSGLSFYQFVLPIDRGNVDAPSTQPSEAVETDQKKQP